MKKLLYILLAGVSFSFSLKAEEPVDFDFDNLLEDYDESYEENEPFNFEINETLETKEPVIVPTYDPEIEYRELSVTDDLPIFGHPEVEEHTLDEDFAPKKIFNIE